MSNNSNHTIKNKNISYLNECIFFNLNLNTHAIGQINNSFLKIGFSSCYVLFFLLTHLTTHSLMKAIFKLGSGHCNARQENSH